MSLEHRERWPLISNVLSYRNHSSQPPQITCSHNCSNKTSYLLLNSTTWILSLESLVGWILQEEDQVITSLRVTRPFHFVIVPLSLCNHPPFTENPELRLKRCEHCAHSIYLACASPDLRWTEINSLKLAPKIFKMTDALKLFIRVGNRWDDPG